MAFGGEKSRKLFEASPKNVKRLSAYRALPVLLGPLTVCTYFNLSVTSD
jgi:hypothetical protein